jgi:hypothetical protein
MIVIDSIIITNFKENKMNAKKMDTMDSPSGELTEDKGEILNNVDIPENRICEGAINIPLSVVSGNAQIEILKHDFIKEKGTDIHKGVSINLKNISGYHIGRAIFQVIFYDDAGKIIRQFVKDTWDFESNSSRIMAIYFDLPDAGVVRSYNIQLIRVIMSPVPAATGNDKIEITNHIFLAGNNPFGSPIKGGGVELSVRNNTDETIASTVYNALFFDLEGNVIDTVRYRDLELKPHCSRAIVIESDKLIGEPARCYNVSILKTIMTDIEKVQIRTHEIQRKPSGKAIISGFIKNVSEVKSDAVIVATFTDYQNEKLGTRAVQIKDVEPGVTRKFSFTFDNPSGERIKSYTIDIGDMIE